ncbi:MAG: molybdenum cofactor biosynthesis protein MoaE [Terricaulis sp.]
MRIRIIPDRFSPEQEFAAFLGAYREDAGACATFTGLCRGGAVRWLELEHYPGFTEARIAACANQIAGALLDLLIVHRVGRVAPGEAIVFVAALASHRAEAFAAVERLMDYLKTDAPFWKREMTDLGSTWIEPTPLDLQRRARHEETST